MAESNEPETSVQQQPQPGMVQCQITGHWLPEDETVEFQGYRVGAEGKQILLEQLRSGQSAGSTDRPSVLRRFGCIFLDDIIMWVLGVVCILGFDVLAGFPFTFHASTNGHILPRPNSQMIDQAIVYLGVAFLVLLYFGLMHGTRGATIGKLAGKLQVVNLDGSKIDMRTGMWRSFCFVGPRLLAAAIGVVLLAVFVSPVILFVNVGITYLAIAYILADVIVALVDSQQQRALHDRLAGTRVIYLDA